MGDKASWPTIEWLATRSGAADTAVSKEEAEALLAAHEETRRERDEARAVACGDAMFHGIAGKLIGKILERVPDEWVDMPHDVDLKLESCIRRAVEGEARRRLEDDKACLAKALQEAERKWAEETSAETKAAQGRAEAAESALEQARRELEQEKARGDAFKRVDEMHMRERDEARRELAEAQAKINRMEGHPSTHACLEVELQAELKRARKDLDAKDHECAKLRSEVAHSASMENFQAVLKAVEQERGLADSYRLVIEQLASLLSCEPGAVLERVKEIREKLLCWRNMSFSGDEHEYQLAAERLAQMAEALAPSRPASEPARAICDKHHTGGGSYYVDECPQCQAAPPASVAEQAQEKCSECHGSGMPAGFFIDGRYVAPHGVCLTCGGTGKPPAKPSEGD